MTNIGASALSEQIGVGLERADAATIFRQGPVFNERLPAPEVLAVEGQTIVNRDLVDAQQILESVGLSYLADRWLLTLDGRSEPIRR